MPNSYKRAVQQAKEDIRSISAEVKALELEIAKSSINISNSLKRAFNVKTTGQFNDQLKAQQDQINKLNATIKNLSKTNTNLANQKRKLTKLTIDEKISLKSLTDQKKLEEQSTNKLAGAYANLSAKQRIAKKNLRDLIASGKASNRQIDKAQRKFDQLTKKINRANKASSNFSKNGLGKMARGFRNLIGGFGLVLGIQLMADFTRAVFNNLKTLDKLAFSMAAVVKNEGEMARTRAFLNDITIRFGAELVTTTERYIKFLAAAKQSNVSIQDTEMIFGTVTEAAGVMGLKTEELTGIFLALEQMLSKGKVTTEELRRQLGERLPGAFGLMAKALDVTTAELDKMLRKGEILSKDALPKLAVEIKKAFGLENTDRVRTLQAAQTNLTTSWQFFMEEVRTGQGWLSTTLMSTFEVLTDSFQGWAKIMKGDIGQAETLAFAKSFKELQNNADKWDIPKLNRNLESLGTNLAFQKQALKEINDERAKSSLGISDFFDNQEVNNMQLVIGKLQGQIKAVQALIDLKNDEAKVDAEAKETLINKIILKDESFTQDKLEAMNLKELTDLWMKMNEEKGKNAIVALKGTIQFQKNLISTLEKERDSLAKTQKQYNEYTKQIIAAQFELSKLEGTMKGIENLLKATTIDEAVEKLGSVLKKLGIEEATIDTEAMKKFMDDFIKMNENGEAATKAFIESQKELFRTLTDTFADAFDIDVSKFDFIFDSLIDKQDELFSADKVAAWAELSKELIGSVLNASLQRFEIELQEAQRTRDLILNSDLASEDQKKAARIKFEREEREIKTRRAKEERKNTLIQIAVDTAAAVAKVLAQSGVLAPLLIPGIIAIGLAQAAIVAAQPLPKFEKGTKNAPKGWAVTQEKRAEPITDKYGNLKTMGTGGGDKLTYLKDGDKVYKSREDYMKSSGTDDINRAVWNMNMASNGRELSNYEAENALLREMKSGSRDMVNALNKKKLSVKINQNINLGNKINFLNSKNDTL